MQEKTLNEYIDEILMNGSCKVYYTTQEQKEGKRVVILKIMEHFELLNKKVKVNTFNVEKDIYYDEIEIKHRLNH